MATVEEIESWLGHPLPEPYRAFLSGTVHSFIAENDCSLLYGREDFVERNTTLEVAEFCPGSVAIGDDSGGSAFVLSFADAHVYSVDMGAMTPDAFHRLADSFHNWQKAGFPHRS